MEDILHLYELKFPITLYHMSLSYNNMIWKASAVDLYLAASQLYQPIYNYISNQYVVPTANYSPTANKHIYLLKLIIIIGLD